MRSRHRDHLLILAELSAGSDRRRRFPARRAVRDLWFLGTLLSLRLEGRVFLPERPSWSPVVARLPVETRKRYLIVLALAGADWLPQDPFVLTTQLQP